MKEKYWQSFEVTQETGVGRETIRFYEKKGILNKPRRKSSGYRQYSRSDIEVLLFIRDAKSVGFSLKEIESILSLREKKTLECALVIQLLDDKIGRLENEINVLNSKILKLKNLSLLCSNKRESSSCTLLSGPISTKSCC